MVNLLEETQTLMKNIGYCSEDIQFIGSAGGHYRCTWKEFTKLANKAYNNGKGEQNVASDLIIVFHDGISLHRTAYKGVECWDFSQPLILESPKPITNLFTQDRLYNKNPIANTVF